MKAKWPTFKLADVCDQITDGKHGDCENQSDSGFFFLSAKDILDGRLAYENARQITESDFDDTNKRTRLEPLDILFTNSGTIGRMALAPADERTLRTTFQKSVAILKPKQSAVEPRFLYYSLLAENRRLSDFAGGTAQKNLLLKDLRAFPIKVPPLAIQERIASTLSAYDDLIENNNRRIKILEEMAQMIYREWFVSLRFPSHEKAKIVKTEKGYKPAGWNSVPFTEVAQFINGFAFGPEHWGNSGRPIIKIKELKSGVTPDTPRYDGEGLDEKYVIHTGDILFSWSADLDVYIWAGEQALLNQHLFRVIPESGYGRLFIFFSLKNQMQAFRSRSMGTTMRHIKRSALDEVQVTIPDRAVLEKFENLITPLVSLVTNLSQNNSSLRRMSNLLLPKLISGEISVEYLEAEAASQVS